MLNKMIPVKTVFWHTYQWSTETSSIYLKQLKKSS